jgi:phytoene dehydrogenase-like protein
MLYLVAAAPPGAGPEAHHLELVPDPSAPFVEGHHLFVSISGADDAGRAAPGHRTLTVSTHVPMAHLRSLSQEGQGRYIAEVQDRMRAGLARLAPEWWSRVTLDMSASPRTFERFTGRSFGYVGGIPRRAGWHHYLDLVPEPVLPGLHLVGDSVFPGQSTLATAVGGLKVAERLLSRGLRTTRGRAS